MTSIWCRVTATYCNIVLSGLFGLEFWGGISKYCDISVSFCIPRLLTRLSFIYLPKKFVCRLCCPEIVSLGLEHQTKPWEEDTFLSFPSGKVCIYLSCLALMQVLYSFAQNQDLSKDRTPKSHAWVFGRDEAPDFRDPNWDTWCNTWIGITVIFVFLKDSRDNILVQCASTANSSTLFLYLYHNISELSNLMPSFSHSREQWLKSPIICRKIRDYTSQWYNVI